MRASLEAMTRGAGVDSSSAPSRGDRSNRNANDRCPPPRARRVPLFSFSRGAPTTYTVIWANDADAHLLGRRLVFTAFFEAFGFDEAFFAAGFAGAALLSSRAQWPQL